MLAKKNGTHQDPKNIKDVYCQSQAAMENYQRKEKTNTDLLLRLDVAAMVTYEFRACQNFQTSVLNFSSNKNIFFQPCPFILREISKFGRVLHRNRSC